MSIMKKRDDRNLFPGALEFMILRTLQRQTLHGFALVEQIRRSSNDLLQIEEGALFSALQRLLQDDLVRAEWGVTAGNRKLKVYKLTPSGIRHLEREVSGFSQMLEGITRVLGPESMSVESANSNNLRRKLEQKQQPAVAAPSLATN
jgi:PadR family transcriptional regulator, regulatory protein PadR